MKSRSDGRDAALTIVSSSMSYDGYEFDGLSRGARNALTKAIEISCAPYQVELSARLLKLFDIYLFLTDEQVDVRSMARRVDMLRIASGFLGALCSPRFIQLSTHSRKAFTSAFVNAVVTVNPRCHELFGIGRRGYITERETELADEFESKQFSDQRLWTLRGWWIKGKGGHTANLPLYRMFVRFGRKFTQRFHDACAAHWQGRVISSAAALRLLPDFLADRKDVTEACLLDRKYCALLWRDFLIHFSQQSYDGGDGMRASTIINHWNSAFVPLVRDALVPSGLFGAPLGGYPNPRGTDSSGILSNVVLEDGVQVKTKLLTRVPLHLSDAQAAQTLFVDIRRDVELIREWADAEVKIANARLIARDELASKGVPRVVQEIGTNTGGHKFIASKANPDHLRNAAATLKTYGYVSPGQKGREIRLLYPKPLDETARHLGLPVVDSLIPFLTILVAEHPAITSSYLENLELYNRAGVRIGLVKTDGGHYLVGDKPRRGPNDAEQQIRLSDAALAALEGLLNLTELIREYMRTQGDDDWRYLLLTCGKGFGRPHRVLRVAQLTSYSERVRSISAGLMRHCGLSLSRANDLAQRFSLSRLRASAGTLVYLSTQSVQKMSEALGHKNYDPDLLSRYLPSALEEFFRERWIRIFQNGILAEALKNSPYLLQSTDFESAEELSEFLSQHALKLLPVNESVRPPQSQSEVAFGLDVGVLSVLIGIERAVGDALNRAEQPSKNALKWAGVSRALIGYVESTASGREDIQQELAMAKLHAEASDFRGFVHA